jgi:hypothetical protein
MMQSLSTAGRISPAPSGSQARHIPKCLLYQQLEDNIGREKMQEFY